VSRKRSTCGSPPTVAVNPGTGKIQIGDKNMPAGINTDECTKALMYLSRLDDGFTFRQLLDKANAANTSFYPIDPRGLPVFDSPIDQPLPLAVDASALRTRADSLRTIAENTDGLAMLNNNDLAGSFRKIVNDLSSYYLLGYYSNGKLDGKFHSIRVRIKRPGVQVRARRGYLAASAAELTRASSAPAAVPGAAAQASAMPSAFIDFSPAPLLRPFDARCLGGDKVAALIGQLTPVCL